MNDDIASIEVAIEEGWEETICDSEEEWREQVDEGKAFKIAERLSNKIWAPRRILNLMEKWTGELMDIPQVWAVVEKLSQRLIEDGQILDEEFLEITKPIYFKWIESPVWKRRFLFNPEKDS